MHYAGIGSRDTPNDIGLLMTAIAAEMELIGWTLRSGGATGADTFFENGVTNPKNKEIYIHKEYAHGKRHNPNLGIYNAQRFPDYANAVAIAAKVHPMWHRCNTSAQQLHARNVYQVLGPQFLEPSVIKSKLVVCWAIPDIHGVPEGGTRTAWMVAKLHEIPRYNLAVREDRERITQWLESRHG
ncbi:hypothetical protein D3C75_511840 [compost metagenome]